MKQRERLEREIDLLTRHIELHGGKLPQEADTLPVDLLTHAHHASTPLDEPSFAAAY